MNQLKDTSLQWLVSKYTIAIVASATHLQEMSFKTGASQGAVIKVLDMGSLEILSEGKDCHKIRAEVIYYAISFHRIHIFTHP